MAFNCFVCPAAMEEEIGVMAMDESVGEVMVIVFVPEIDPVVAVAVICPDFNAETRPELLMDATVASEECHVAAEVMSFVVLSLYVAMAVNCSVRPATTDDEVALTLTELTVADCVGVEGLLDPPPQATEQTQVRAMRIVARCFIQTS